MELALVGTEVHVLRETLEKIIVALEQDIGIAAEPMELVKKEEVLKSILEKLPAEFAGLS